MLLTRRAVLDCSRLGEACAAMGNLVALAIGAGGDDVAEIIANAGALQECFSHTHSYIPVAFGSGERTPDVAHKLCAPVHQLWVEVADVSSPGA
eukprot:10421221-Alexandrium_andersonii.AAC.1